MSSKHFLSFGALAVILVGILFAPIRLPQTVDVPGRILSAREWVVRMDDGGVVVTTLTDRIAGAVSSASVLETTRGDAVRLELSRLVRPGERIHAGDTLATIRSNELERLIAELEGGARSAEASLLSTTTGQKEAVVHGASQQLERARRNEDALRAVLARQKLLFEKGLIAEQEYELAEKQATLATMDVSIAGANLRALSTGDKREQQDLMAANVGMLRRELEVIRQREHDCILKAPFSGVVLCSGVSDTLLLLVDATKYVVMMPVPVREREHVAIGQHISIAGEGFGEFPAALVSIVSSPVQMLGTEQVFLVTGLCEGSGNGFLHGALVRCAIRSAPCSPSGYLKTLLTRSVRP